VDGYEDLYNDITALRAGLLHRYIIQGDRGK
jgi:hypothetical protein